MQMKRQLSDAASYRKRVARDCLFSELKYDKLISKNAVRTDEERASKRMQVEVAKEKLMQIWPGTTDYDMSYLRRCDDMKKLEYSSIGIAVSETESLPVISTEGVGEDNDGREG